MSERRSAEDMILASWRALRRCAAALLVITICVPVASSATAAAASNASSSAASAYVYDASSATTTISANTRTVTLVARQVMGGQRSSTSLIALGRAAKAVAPAKRTTGTTVLGQHPGYVQLSEKLGARRFDVPQNVWARMSDAERWAANQRFLDRTIARGDDIVLATPLDRVRAGSFFEREIRYLISQGYRPNAAGTRLLGPGG